MSKIYAAYGSNLNIYQMGHRCPTAKIIGVGRIKDYELLFAGCATIRPAEKQEVMVGVWEIQESDEQALDNYEGYPHFYRKEILDVDLGNKRIVQAMVYIMNKPSWRLPGSNYLSIIMDGYEDFGLDMFYLKESLEKTEKLKNY